MTCQKSSGKKKRDIKLLSHIFMADSTFWLILPQHVSREFYNGEGKVVLKDAGVWITPLDYLGIKPFADVPIFRNASFAPQDGVYGGFPYYMPLRHMIRQIYFSTIEYSDSNNLTTTGMIQNGSPTPTTQFFQRNIVKYFNLYTVQ